MWQLQCDSRVTYRTLKYVFGIDEALIEEIREELTFRRLATDEDGKGLIWTTVNVPTLSPPVIETSTPSNGPTATPEAISIEARQDEPAVTPEPVHIAPEAERRQLTVMFCDLADSTKLSQQLDPEDLREVIQSYQATAAEVIRQYDGHIAQYLGDGLLVYFGWPAAHEDDAQRALHVSLGIVEAITTALNPSLSQEKGVQLTVRIGIHTGSVVVGEMGGGGRHENLATGETVNIAARLEGLAHPNTVLISQVTARLVRDAFLLEELGAQRLKGVAEPIPVYRVLSPLEVDGDEDATIPVHVSLVGRDEEVGLLIRRWEQSKEGLGQVVLISGEAGIGKSSLMATVRHHVVQAGDTRLTFRCSPYHTNSALYPVIEHIQRLLQFQPGDTPETKLDKLEGVLGGYSRPLEEVVPLYAALLSVSLPEGRYMTQNMTPQQQRQQTQDALVGWLLEEAERQPTLAMWEDLHWADPSTLEMLGLVLEQTPTVPMLHVLTYRPELTPPWPSRSHMTPITLNRLERPQVEALIAHLAGGKAMPAEVVEHIVAKTDGVPLFVEELTKMLLESGLLRSQANAYELMGPLSAVAIPATLQDSLMARLDRLSNAREIAQRGAVLGREFTYDMLRTITPLDDDAFQHGLKQLVEAELLYQRGRPPRASYIFKHALVQDVAYASLLRRTRQQIHQQIAHVLETRMPEAAETQPELLAHHVTQAGLTEQAVDYWYRAGQQASQRWANREAIGHYRQGLELLNTLPDTPEHLQCQLNLHIALGREWIAVKGYSAPEVEEAYACAQALCQQTGMTSQLFPILCGLWTFYHVSGNLQTAHELAEQLLDLAPHLDYPNALTTAHDALAFTLIYQGEFARAYAHEEQAMRLYTPQPHHAQAPLMGHDAGVSCRSQAAACLWWLGYPDRAVCRSDEALRLAEELAHPYSHAYALYFAAALHRFRREWQVVLAHVENLMVLASEQGFTHFSVRAPLLRGWALVEGGQVEAGVAQMHQALDDVDTRGMGIRTWMHVDLAEAYGKLGEPAKGLAEVDAGLASMETNEERRDIAELHRLKGKLLLSQSTDHQSEAETHFHQALRCAQTQQARSLELRAATSLSRLWQRQGKVDEARHLLARVYNWFTEGFDTADLQKAKALLEALQP